MTELSVAMPVRNCERFVVDAIDSLKKQTHPDFEVHLIDDSSSDLTFPLCKSATMGDPRFVLRRSPSSGLCGALNFAIENCDSAFFGRMDGDDVCFSARLEKQANFLKRHPAYAGVGTQVNYIDVHGELTGKCSQFPCTATHLARHLRTKGCAVSHPSVVLRTDMVRRLGGYRAAFEFAEDFDLWLRLIEIGQLANMSEILLSQRQHEGQVSVVNELRQRFSRDLAILCHRFRAKYDFDPMEGTNEPLPLDPDHSSVRRLPQQLQDLVVAYAAIDLIQRGCHLNPVQMSAVFEAGRQGLLGDGRKRRARTLVEISRRAACGGHIRLALRSVIRAVLIAPRTVLSTPGRRLERSH